MSDPVRRPGAGSKSQLAWYHRAMVAQGAGLPDEMQACLCRVLDLGVETPIGKMARRYLHDRLWPR